MKDIYLTALAIATRSGPDAGAIADLATLDPDRAILTQGTLDGGVPSKDRRILDDDDLLAVEAGVSAMRAAGLSAADEDLGCVVFTTGKGVPAAERGQQRTRYRDAADRPDMRRFMQALDCGEEVVDPFTLLRDLDNGLVWWLCKTYAISGFNLQVNQTQSPDYFAFLEAMEALDDGLCARVLVGGLRTGPREAVAEICRRREEPATPDTAIFFILELAEGPPAQALARLELVAANEGVGCGEGTLDFSLALVAALTRLDQGCVRLSAHDRPWSIDIRRAS